MRILWLCNVILPEFSNEFRVRETPVGGWISGMLYTLSHFTDLEIALCFPIIDKERLRDGFCAGYRYYSILSPMNSPEYITYDESMVARFEEIIKNFEPDIIHIWGTEYPHTAALVRAAQRKKLLSRTVINIQGLVSVYQKHYYASLPENVINGNMEGSSIAKDRQLFIERGKAEAEALGLVGHVIGRTDWDRACALQINPGVRYHFCNEILRDSFYICTENWKAEQCERHSLFVSQASYPIKGFHMLLQAMPHILEYYPDTQVKVAGSPPRGTYGIYIQHLIKVGALGDNITFLGRLDEQQMMQQYLKAHIFVTPSSIENSPNSLCEAMLLGLPCVSSFVGGISSFVTHSLNGYLYPFDSPYMLSYYIQDIFDKTFLAEKLGETAKNEIFHLHSPRLSGEMQMEIYNEIVKTALEQ